MENPVLIFGAKGLGLVALDIFQRNNVVVYGLLDDDPNLHHTQIGEYTVLGNTDDDGFLKLIGKKCEAFVAIEARTERKDLVEMLNERRSVMPVNAIHDTAVISSFAEIGHGNLIGARVTFSPKAVLGHHSILHTGVSVEHDAIVGNYVNIGAGSVIGSGAVIEHDVFVGSGATIVSGVKIGKGASIGAGSVVVENVPAGSRVFGNPAKKV
ncbi:acetyltransferase [Runella slithyformis]|uniref:Sugar O-acyltransferase, sialic acid O-acetyltransferase NeuD family n=1 Tax=Runella slithyformis (strain ATCC 29530 / DSM 19594 / LMG 11500 / NCIMB 11436 / LSU 4) TaxID=761193 RepID=A0A7U3ZQY3_RUNSL|nr:acetyltransferase [Runella slithyformis]AEI51739.1 sugar O-acyltransferase, sialic acid O-acetyltransferase NeuD family [Runella slithyformis DSM 19594]